MKKLQDAGLIKAIGVTDFDAAHLELALAEGIPLVSNQVSFSLMDRRAAGEMADLCMAKGIKLLAYGTLCGGFLTDKSLGQPQPADIADWNPTKYMRFIETAGGWDAFQTVLQAAAQVARRHGVSLSNVASRWVLEQPHVAGVIIGARLGEAEHRADNLKLFQFSLDSDDHALLDAAFAQTKPIPRRLLR